jgi:hypothetical protein
MANIPFQQTGRSADGEFIPMAPGDEAPVGTPGTGQDVCRTCAGTGEAEGESCTDCAGTGWVNVGIGGA